MSLEAPKILVMEVTQPLLPSKAQVVLCCCGKPRTPLAWGEEQRETLHLNYLYTELKSMKARMQHTVAT